MFDGPPGTDWTKRIRRVLDLVDTPTRYGSTGQALVLDATGRELEWLTVNTEYYQLDMIILYTPLAVLFNANDTGMAQAIAAASSGDTIWIPPSTYSDDYVVPAGVTVKGNSRDGVIFSGEFTLNSGSKLENLSVIRSENDSNTYYGVKTSLDTDETAELYNCTISVTQAGGGDGYGVNCAYGTLNLFYSRIYGSSGDTDDTAPWWEPSGGLGAVAIYQPKGAANWSASLTDLSGNGNHAYDDGDPPSWDTTNGWIFSGTQHLLTNVVGNGSGGRTIIACMRPGASDYLMVGVGAEESGNKSFYVGIYEYYSPPEPLDWQRVNVIGIGGALLHSYGRTEQTSKATNAGSDNDTYEDGVWRQAVAAWGGGDGTVPVHIGVINGYNYGGPVSTGGWVYAVAIYDTSLTAGEVLSVHNAMMAL